MLDFDLVDKQTQVAKQADINRYTDYWTKQASKTKPQLSECDKQIIKSLYQSQLKVRSV